MLSFSCNYWQYAAGQRRAKTPVNSVLRGLISGLLSWPSQAMLVQIRSRVTATMRIYFIRLYINLIYRRQVWATTIRLLILSEKVLGRGWSYVWRTKFTFEDSSWPTMTTLTWWSKMPHSKDRIVLKRNIWSIWEEIWFCWLEKNDCVCIYA